MLPLQKVTLETTIRLKWYDPRISLDLPEGKDYLIVNRNPTLDIWFPDLYIDRAIQLRVPTYVIEPKYLKITNTSLLTYSARVNYEMKCAMLFYDYPVNFVLFKRFSSQVLAFHRFRS